MNEDDRMKIINKLPNEVCRHIASYLPNKELRICFGTYRWNLGVYRIRYERDQQLEKRLFLYPVLTNPPKIGCPLVNKTIKSWQSPFQRVQEFWNSVMRQPSSKRECLYISNDGTTLEYAKDVDIFRTCDLGKIRQYYHMTQSDKLNVVLHKHIEKIFEQDRKHLEMLSNTPPKNFQELLRQCQLIDAMLIKQKRIQKAVSENSQREVYKIDEWIWGPSDDISSYKLKFLLKIFSEPWTTLSVIIGSIALPIVSFVDSFFSLFSSNYRKKRNKSKKEETFWRKGYEELNTWIEKTNKMSFKETNGKQTSLFITKVEERLNVRGYSLTDKEMKMLYLDLSSRNSELAMYNIRDKVFYVTFTEQGPQIKTSSSKKF